MTGTNFSSWYNSAQGVLFANWSSYIPVNTVNALTYPAGFTDSVNSSTAAQLVIQNRAASNQIRIWQSTTDGGLDDFAILTTTTFQGKAAVAYGTGTNVSGSANGSSVVTIPNPIQTTVFNALTIGAASNLGGLLGGHLRSIVYYPTRLSSAELQAITTY